MQGCAPRLAEPLRVAKLMSLLPFLQARLASVLQTASLYLAVDAEVGAAGGEGKGRMTLAATAKGRELDPYYMVITNNYRLERGRRRGLGFMLSISMRVHAASSQKLLCRPFAVVWGSVWRF